MPRMFLVGALALLSLVLSACGGGPSEASATKQASVVAESEDENFVEWTRLSAMPIESVAPGAPFSGLESLGDIVGDARIVAVGEPVYGAREVTLIKRRMFELRAGLDARTTENVATPAWFERPRPVSLVIDEVETLWSHIAERDDWSAFALKLAEIDELRGALKLSR